MWLKVYKYNAISRLIIIPNNNESVGTDLDAIFAGLADFTIGFHRIDLKRFSNTTLIYPIEHIE